MGLRTSTLETVLCIHKRWIGKNLISNWALCLASTDVSRRSVCTKSYRRVISRHRAGWNNVRHCWVCIQVGAPALDQTQGNNRLVSCLKQVHSRNISKNYPKEHLCPNYCEGAMYSFGWHRILSQDRANTFQRWGHTKYGITKTHAVLVHILVPVVLLKCGTANIEEAPVMEAITYHS